VSLTKGFRLGRVQNKRLLATDGHRSHEIAGANSVTLRERKLMRRPPVGSCSSVAIASSRMNGGESVMAVTREPEFGTVRMREGYDLDEVDDFVDLVIDTLEDRGTKRVTPEEIERYEFRVVRLKTSYDMEDVDRWLDEAAAELRARAKGYQASSESAEATTDNSSVQSVAELTSDRTAPTDASSPVFGGTQTTASAPQAGYGVPPAQPSNGQTEQPAADSQAYGMYVPTYTQSQQPTYVAPQHTKPAYTQSAYSQPAYTAPAYVPPTYPQPGREQPLAAEQTYTSTQPTGPLDRQSTRPVALIHHVELWVRDFESAVASFGWLFKNIGWRIGRAWDSGCAWTSPGGPYIIIESGPDLVWMPYERRGPGLNHLAFEVSERSLVDRIASDGPSHGWQLMFADRHPYAGGPDHYAAYLENAEGFEVEIIAAE
jgi:DivIVA domain-containing protein